MIFAQDDMIQEYARRLTDSEQLLVKKEVEITLLKEFSGKNAEGSMALARETREAYGLPPVLAALELRRSMSYYH